MYVLLMLRQAIGCTDGNVSFGGVLTAVRLFKGQFQRLLLTANYMLYKCLSAYRVGLLQLYSCGFTVLLSIRNENTKHI